MPSRRTMAGILTAVLCAAPAIAMLFGADFSTGSVVVAETSSHFSGAETDHLHHLLAGSFTHTLLEWTAVCCAGFVALLAYLQFKLHRDPSLLVIGIALACAGAMDAFHTFAADRLITARASNERLVPFTWAVCRLFNACIILVGIVAAMAPPLSAKLRRRGSGIMVGVVSATFVAVAYAIIYTCSSSPNLPRTMYENSIITRPFDIAPLVPYLICLLLVCPRYARQAPSRFADALMLSLIPHIATQLYMAFGSTALHDSAFNVAHALKAVAYFVPAAGLLGEYVARFKAVQEAETALMSQSRALEQALDQAEAATRSKSAFLANMSHEIRTPMTAILGFAETLQDDALSDDERRSAVSTILRNGRYLLAIINDILDLSKIESGRLICEHRRTSTAALLDEVNSLMRMRTEEKHIALSVEFAGRVPEYIHTDPIRLRQILVNLVGNAVKFTPEGGRIRIVAGLIDGKGASRIYFDIEDTGIGISDEQAARLFEPFRQADSTTTRLYGGTGLGLTISRRLAELLGGDVVLRCSKPGVGSTFRATVATGPLDGVRLIERPDQGSIDDATTQGKSSEEGVIDLTGVTVLLVEDGPDNQRLIRFLLERAGARVLIQDNGRAALSFIDSPDFAQARIDLILMDIQMPELDGYEATRRIRALGLNLPIVALTANAMAGDRERCLQAGCDAFHPKPVDRRRLIELIHKLTTNIPVGL